MPGRRISLLALERRKRYYYIRSLRMRRDRTLSVDNCSRLRRLLYNFPKVQTVQLESGGWRKCRLWVCFNSGHELTVYEFHEIDCMRRGIRETYLTLAGVKQ